MVSAEVSPIARTGGLGDVCGALPKALARLGHEVVVCMPYYRQAREYFQAAGLATEPVVAQTLSGGNGTADLTIMRAQLPGSEIPLLLMANEHFFDRPALYAPDAAGRDDGVERFAFFCRAVVHTCELLDIRPDIVHAHDWHAALLPVYFDAGLRQSPQFATASSVFTIHNLNYQGIGTAGQFAALGLGPRYWRWDALEHYGQLNPMKGAILFADRITTVSPTYAREIQTPAYGAGLDGLLRLRASQLTGILNGIDTEVWNPATDDLLEANFEPGKMLGKTISKRMLAREAGLRYKARTPLLGVVSRFVDQKGFDLLLPVLPRLIRAGAQAVILGSGDEALEDGFRRVEAEFPNACRVWTGFDNGLAHRIIAGADLVLMPSRYEPCGLNQMYALRYGTIPVVRLTGGLADTVLPYDGTNRDQATGFGFTAADPEEIYRAAWSAMLNYRDKRLWETLQGRGMTMDFSWDTSARHYEDVYQRVAG
jgi:starch synthase